MKRKVLLATTSVALIAWIGCTHSERKAEESAEYKEQPVAERGVAASNGEFSFPSGTYGTHYWYTREDRSAPDRLIFDFDRGVIKVNDLKNHLIYTIDINNRNEQELNPQVIEKIRNTPGARTLGRLIKKITVSNVNVPRDGEVEATFNVYVVDTTPFGSISATVQVGASVKRQTCETVKNMTYTGSYTYKPPRAIKATCLKVETATHVDVAALTTTLRLSSNITNGLGLTADLLLKVLSPVMGSDRLYYEYQ